MSTNGRIYQFRIVLHEVSPPVWRLIQVPKEYTFWELHVAIQDAMGWMDYHLHVFHLEDPVTGRFVLIGNADEGDDSMLPGSDIPIARYFLDPGDSADYEYDLGDSWEHEVTLEAIVPRLADARYPVCVGGERACPPEDCGGPRAYQEFLNKLRDPEHEDNESALEWLGDRGDPESFDPKKVRFDDPVRRWRIAFE